MKGKLAYLMPAALALAGVWAGPAQAEDCTGRWELFSSAPLEQIALPDTYVTYWRYRYEVPWDRPFVLRVHGQYPHGRYMNYNVYDQETMDTTGASTDIRISPDEGSENPFQPGVLRETRKRDYTLWVVPKGMTPLAGMSLNLLEMPTPIPEGDSKAVELWYRIYLPDPGAGPNGNVDLPRVEAFSDLSARTPVACPARRTLSAPLWRALSNLPVSVRDGEIVFYRTDGTTLYANFDTKYLVGRMSFRDGEVAAVRFKAPTFPDTHTGVGPFPGQVQVRYWSMCLGGANTRTTACVDDYDAKKDAQGWINLVVGPEEIGPRVKALGLNFLPAPGFLVPFLVYRNLLDEGGFEGSFLKVPHTRADRFIGDFAPRGRHCSAEEFFRSYCGVFGGDTK